jgi:cytochrome c peroxidase
MTHRHRMAQLGLLVLFAVGCERAQKFPSQAVTAEKEAPPTKVTEPSTVPITDGWLEESPRFDVRLRFVAETNDPELWNKLPQFWNESSSPVAIATGPLGLLSPLEAATAFAAHVLPGIVIKVPRGLPDPTPHIPSANPPTYARWLLGKKLFFDDRLLSLGKGKLVSCASCHNPNEGFTVHEPTPPGARYNAPSLINCVYNRHQFWDGRAASLEEVLLRKLQDLALPPKDPEIDQSPGYRHVWPGLVARLNQPHYKAAFERVFGQWPTADNAAKALATYLRTILAGDSVYDRAEWSKRERKETALKDADFFTGQRRRQRSFDTAYGMVRGYSLYAGLGRCASCHPAPLFSDQYQPVPLAADRGFHNIGIGESGLPPIIGKEPSGRFAALPYGLKDTRMIGAFKTPSLRHLDATAPYMHDGSLVTLEDVVRYYSTGVRGLENPYLDRELKDDSGHPRHLNLDNQEMEFLVIFLRSLQGEPVDPVVAAPPARWAHDMVRDQAGRR